MLAGALNIRASNNPFLAKKDEYANSNIQMTRQIGEKYDDFRFEDVHERSQALAKRAVEIWSFPVA